MEPIDVLRSGRRYCALTMVRINQSPLLSSVLGDIAALPRVQGSRVGFLFEIECRLVHGCFVLIIDAASPSPRSSKNWHTKES